MCDQRPRSALDHRHSGTRRHAVVEIDDVLIEQAEAAARNGLADTLRFVSAMQAEKSVVTVTVKIERTGPEWIV